MHTPNTWIIVANNAKARIFKRVKPGKLEELTTLLHVEGRLRNQDLTSTKPGVSINSGQSHQNAYETKTSARVQEEEKFAKELADFLAKEHKAGHFGRLYLFVSPHFLGFLRKELSEKVVACIEKECNKDWTAYTRQELEKEIENV